MKKEILLYVGITFLFLGLSVAPLTQGIITVEPIIPISDGNTLYVGGSGPNNYTKIQDAIDNASDGDTVFVYDDSSPYKENVVVDKSINLIGENRDTTILDNHRIGDVINIIKDGVTINSFTFTNASTKGGGSAYGIKISSDDNRIINTIVLNNWWGIYCKSISNNTFIGNIIKDNVYGIRLEESNNNLIYENIFNSNTCQHLIISDSNLNTINKNIIKFGSKYGILIGDANNINLTYNSLYHCGIDFHDSIFSNFSHNTINGKPFIYMVGESNKSIKETGQIFLKDCINITIQNLDISNVSCSISGENNSNCLIADNIFDNTYGGIQLGKFSSNNTIRNNIISNSSDGIRLSGAKDCIIRDNKIYQSDWIYIPHCTNISIINNTLIKGGWNIYLQSSKYCNISNNIISQGYFGIFLEDTSKYNVIHYNVINNNKIGIKIRYSSNNNISNNDISGNKLGIKLKGSSNEIFHNNFIKNLINAFFSVSKNNIWKENYWDNWIGLNINRPIFQKFPKIIYGFLGVNIDWRPAKEPYDIEV